MIGSDRCAKTRTISQLRGKDQTVPYGTDLLMDIFQAAPYSKQPLAINLPATPTESFGRTLLLSFRKMRCAGW